MKGSSGSTSVWLQVFLWIQEMWSKMECLLPSKVLREMDTIILIKLLASGARSIICEQLPKKLNKDVVYIQVNDSRAALGYITN